MRQLIYNLSIRSKILIGFFMVTAIFFMLGIYQYNALENVNHTNEMITFAKDMNSTAAQIKYLVAKDMNVLRNFNFAKNDKELKSLHKEHVDYVEKLNTIFNSIANITTSKKVNAMLRYNFRDTIHIVKNKYINEFCTNYNEFHVNQRTLINPDDLSRLLKIKISEAQGSSSDTANIRISAPNYSAISEE